MSVKGMVLALAAVVAAAGAVIWTTGGDEPSRSPAGEASAVAVATGGPEDLEASALAPVSPAKSEEAAQEPVIEARREAVPRAGTQLAGRVVDKATGSPVSRFYVTVRREVSRGKGKVWDAVRWETLEDAGGAFRIPLDQTGRYRLRVETSRHRAWTLDDLELAGPEGVSDLLVQLDAGLAVSGRVVDDRTTEPIRGAVVGSAGFSASTLETLAKKGDTEECLHAVTGADGRFTLSGLDAESQKIAAAHPDYAEGWQQVLPAEGAFLEVRLKRGPIISGTVFDDAGQPKEGVRITLFGDELPLQRPLVSGKDGAYRTPPVRPGIVELYAEEAPGFSKEWQVTEIAGEDVQVDFGTRKDYVQWRGTFYGYDGEPQAFGRLHVFFNPAAGLLKLRSQSRTAECDDQARFELPKLPMGSYWVSPTLADGSHASQKLTLHFDEPGLVERDIRLDVAPAGEELGAIRGVVIDEATGAPVVVERYGFVSASKFTPVYESFTADLDDQGCFHLRGLPPGSYQVQASAGDRAPGSQEVIVARGQVVDGVRIMLPACGTLRLRLAGFLETDPRDFKVHIAREGGGRSWTVEEQLPENGAWEVTWPVAEGEWTATVTFGGLGVARRSFQILRGSVTEVRIGREDVSPFVGAVTVAGSLRHPDGTPLANTKLWFWADEVLGVEKAARSKSAETDQDGLFSACDFLPGLWRVYATPGSGAHCNLPSFVIPPQAVSPYTLHLVVPAGSVSGVLVNRVTGQPLGEEGPRWWIWVIDQDTHDCVAEIQGGHTGSRFEVPGVPAGNLRVNVRADGFAVYESESVQFAGAGNVDLGSIRLDPCGVLDFQVVDELGQPILTFQLLVDGEALPGGRVRMIGENSYRCSDLPAGTMTFEVTAEGFRLERKTLTLQAGEPAAAKFVLERR